METFWHWNTERSGRGEPVDNVAEAVADNDDPGDGAHFAKAMTRALSHTRLFGIFIFFWMTLKSWKTLLTFELQWVLQIRDSSFKNSRISCFYEVMANKDFSKFQLVLNYWTDNFDFSIETKLRGHSFLHSSNFELLNNLEVETLRSEPWGRNLEVILICIVQNNLENLE